MLCFFRITIRKELVILKQFLKKFIGDKHFYKVVLLVAVPIMVQNGITNLVSLLDNIMVGRIGTEQMSGVAIVNQLMLVYNIGIFGAVSGAGIFGAQFYGKGDNEGVRYAFRFKLIVCLALSAIWMVLFLTLGGQVVQYFLHEGTDAGDIVATAEYAREYLLVVMPGMIPYAIAQSYTQTLRETGETILPMKAGVTAVVVNLVFDYLLIYGKFGFPELGVFGAAAATVLSRVVECVIVIWWTHHHKEKNPFIVHAFESLYVPARLTKQIIIKGLPLLMNETMWAAGMAVLNQTYSNRGLEVVAGLNISGTVSNLFNVVFIAMGSAIAIMVGQLLGAGKLEEAVDTDRKMITFSVFSCFIIGTIMILIAPLFPRIYNTSETVRKLASEFIIVASACMPLYAFTHAAYFTLRSGGKTMVTFLFDSVYVWLVCIPLAMFLVYQTDFPIFQVYFICQLTEIVKCLIGFILVKKRVWVNNLSAS